MVCTCNLLMLGRVRDGSGDNSSLYPHENSPLLARVVPGHERTCKQNTVIPHTHTRSSVVVVCRIDPFDVGGNVWVWELQVMLRGQQLRSSGKELVGCDVIDKARALQAWLMHIVVAPPLLSPPSLLPPPPPPVRVSKVTIQRLKRA